MTPGVDRVEMLNAMANLAECARALYEGSVAAGFTEQQALALTEAWIKAAVSAPPQ